MVAPVVPRSCNTSVTRLFTISGPLSICITLGHPKVPICCIRHLAISWPVDPLHIAAKDNEEDEVDSIIDHVGDPKRKTNMDFLVKWTGYDDSENLLLPWSELRLNPKLHTYLREHNLEKLIPK